MNLLPWNTRESFLKRALIGLFVVAAAAGCQKTPSPSTTGQPIPGLASSAQPAGQPGTPAQPGAPPAAKPVPAQLPAVVAKVNGESIERWELETAIHGVEGRAGTPMPPERRDEIVRGLVDQLIAYHVLAQQAHARQMDASDADVDARVAQMKSGLPSPEAFQQALAAQGMSVDQLRQQTRMSIQVSKVIDTEITKKLSVPDTDVEKFYKENVERFKQGETVHASHILIAVPKEADAAAKKQARAKAQQVLKTLQGGADFATIARAQSMDPGSAKNGGDLGFFPKGQMEPTFEKTAFGLKPGAMSGIVETPFGFHIIKVLERRGPRTAPLEEVGPDVKQFLTNQQREAKIQAFVNDAKAKSKIEVLI
jgi:peptidyl-prolyl cis-trans isomerase C